MLFTILFLAQFLFSAMIAFYFYRLIKSQRANRTSFRKESQKKLKSLSKKRELRLNVPLSERARPISVQEIVGQEQGIIALRAALCGKNPNHILIYGPPGVGKTAAARVILGEAKTNPNSPFNETAGYVEIDASTLHFDERNIADPLLGCVHDPIYQGAGSYGNAGVPNPKEGAVTEAHGGILFIDEIGEMHPSHLSRLLKVLEERRVMLHSAYYSPDNSNIPPHIHDIFQNGLPADFRLIGATTRSPSEIPAALRSRCVEIFFKSLSPNEIIKVVRIAALKSGLVINDSACALISRYSDNGRGAVKLLQSAGEIAGIEKRTEIIARDVELSIDLAHLPPRPNRTISPCMRIGSVSGLAVFGAEGRVLSVEVSATRSSRGNFIVTGAAEQEEISGRGQKLTRTSMVRSSIENVLTLLRRTYNIDFDKYNLHINFTGGAVIDGPSAGIAVVAAIYSAVFGKPISSEIAMTGEVSIFGKVLPVGGIAEKVAAAQESGIKKLLIPRGNYQSKMPQMVEPIDTVEDAIDILFAYNSAKNA